MGNVIDFLERVGCDASLRHGDGFDEALREHDLDDPEREALAGRDAAALRIVMQQGVHLSTQMGDPIDPERERTPDSPPDDDDGDEDDDDDPPTSDA